MPSEVFDCKQDIRKVVFLPEIRAGFYRLAPGERSAYHSHDLGHEVFLVIEGEAEFDVDGVRTVLKPGQMFVVFAGEKHCARCVGDQPMTLYLSVTPHWEPSHTHWDDIETRLPAVWGSSNVQERDRKPEAQSAITELASQLLETSKSLRDSAVENYEEQEDVTNRLLTAHHAKDQEKVIAALSELQDRSYHVFEGVKAFGSIWNRLAPLVARNYGRDRKTW